MAKYYHILFGRRVVNGNKKRQEKWIEIAEELNLMSDICKKEAKEWKQVIIFK